MKLYDYLRSLPDDAARQDFAKRCGTTANYLWNIARAFDKPAPKARRTQHKMSRLIERESNNLVRRWESNPEDWHITWPEIIGTEGAPPVPANDPQMTISEAA
jgi:hypothetical protein